MYLESFNKEENKRLLNSAYDRINKKFDTDRGKTITDYIVKIAEPFLYGFSLEKMIRDLIIRDLDEFCEYQEITTIQEFESAAINFTKVFCFKMNDINEPLFQKQSMNVYNYRTVETRQKTVYKSQHKYL